METRIKFKLFLSIFIILLSLNTTAQDILMDVPACKHNHTHSFEGFLKSANQHIGEDYDLKYHRCNWTVDPDTIHIEGSVFTIFETLTSDFNMISFQLNDTLEVDSIIYHNEIMNYDRPGNHILNIDLLETIEIHTLDSIEVFYHGYPGITSAFTRHEHSSGSTLWTLSEPYGAKDWWPCKNHLSDKIDSIDIIINCPEQYKAGSNGLLINTTFVDNRVIYHWKHKYRIPAYLISIAVSDYAVWENTFMADGKEVPMLNYAYPQDSTFARQTIDSFLPVMGWLNETFIPYPYSDEKYGHTQMGRGGGMEHTTMTTMGSWSWSVLTHEALHQWFGNYVTCGSWHDIWLNEGFATYFTGVAIEWNYGDSWWERWKSINVENITKEPDGSVYVYDTTDASRIFSGRLTYYKAAHVLHMLRHVVGDEVFYKGINNYLNDPTLLFGYVKTDDLKYHIEAEYGDDLTWYFDDWIYGEGHPIYDVNVIQLNEDVVNITVNQSQSHQSVDFFEMPLPIRLKNETMDTLIVLNHEYSGQEFNLNLGFQVDSVFVDPYHELISADNEASLSVFEMPDVRPIIYPIPANDKLHISFGSLEVKNVFITDINGRLLKSYTILEDQKELIWDTSKAQNGIYLINFVTRLEKFSKKISVIH